jgi:hypothetical protein
MSDINLRKMGRGFVKILNINLNKGLNFAMKGGKQIDMRTAQNAFKRSLKKYGK